MFLLVPRHFPRIVLNPRHSRLFLSVRNNASYEGESEGEEENPPEENDKNRVLYEDHIPTSCLQKLILGAGSAVGALSDPWRADMVAVNGEITGSSALRSIRDKMLKHPEGSRILLDRPRINTKTVDFDRLLTLDPESLGYLYASYNKRWKISPDSRDTVHFVDDEELSYVMQRYREVHDLNHAILDMPTNMVGEVAVKWVEGLQTGLPMCVGGAIFGPLRFSTKQTIKYKKILPWAVRVALNSEFFMNFYFEERWDQNIYDLRQEMNIEEPPTV